MWIYLSMQHTSLFELCSSNSALEIDIDRKKSKHIFKLHLISVILFWYWLAKRKTMFGCSCFCGRMSKSLVKEVHGTWLPFAMRIILFQCRKGIMIARGHRTRCEVSNFAFGVVTLADGWTKSCQQLTVQGNHSLLVVCGVLRRGDVSLFSRGCW